MRRDIGADRGPSLGIGQGGNDAHGLVEYEIALVLDGELEQFFPEMDLITGKFNGKVGIGHALLIDLEPAVMDPLADIAAAGQTAILQIFL